jgi:hypothetical protein
MGNDRSFIARQAAFNKRYTKNHERATEKWADKLVAREEARARATISCPECGAGARKAARFCEQCGKELVA